MKQIFEYVYSFVTITLVLAGLGGVAYNMFKEGGWLGAILGRFWSAQLEYPLVAIPVTLAAVFIGKLWYDHQRSKGYTSKLPSVFVYVVMAAGVYFIWQFATQGKL